MSHRDAPQGLRIDADALQQLGSACDPRLGWKPFALAELLEQRGAWAEAAEAYRQVLEGENLRFGLGPMAYPFWIEQLEPRLPPALEPLHQPWLVLHSVQSGEGPLPVQGWLVLLGPGVRLRPRALQALEQWLLQVALSGPAPDLLSSDEDRLDANGQRCDPWFKPATLAA